MKPQRKLHPDDRALMARALEAIRDAMALWAESGTSLRKGQQRRANAIHAVDAEICTRLAETSPATGHEWEAQAEYRGPARGRTRPGDVRRVTARAHNFDQALAALSDAARGWVVIRETVRELKR